MSQDNFNIYRCLDPIKTQTNLPWYRIEDKCPCNPNLSNVTGRGFTPCTFGLQIEHPNSLNYFQSAGYKPYETPLKGSLYQDVQYVPPQLQPRMLSRIGNVWRSAN